jgi:hypothetical protein
VRSGPGTTHAGEHLTEEWRVARLSLAEVLDEEELALVDDVVAGRRPIPIEAVSPPDATSPGQLDSPFANLVARERPGMRVRVEAMSWAAIAFRVQSSQVTNYVVVPRRWLRSFLQRLDEGALDDALLGSQPVDRGAAGPRVVSEGFDRQGVVPPEPMLRISWWRDRRPELIGLVIGGAVVAGAYRGWPW